MAAICTSQNHQQHELPDKDEFVRMAALCKIL